MSLNCMSLVSVLPLLASLAGPWTCFCAAISAVNLSETTAHCACPEGGTKAKIEQNRQI